MRQWGRADCDQSKVTGGSCTPEGDGQDRIQEMYRIPVQDIPSMRLVLWWLCCTVSAAAEVRGRFQREAFDG